MSTSHVCVGLAEVGNVVSGLVKEPVLYQVLYKAHFEKLSAIFRIRIRIIISRSKKSGLFSGKYKV